MVSLVTVGPPDWDVTPQEYMGALLVLSSLVAPEGSSVIMHGPSEGWILRL